MNEACLKVKSGDLILLKTTLYFDGSPITVHKDVGPAIVLGPRMTLGDSPEIWTLWVDGRCVDVNEKWFDKILCKFEDTI